MHDLPPCSGGLELTVSLRQIPLHGPAGLHSGKPLLPAGEEGLAVTQQVGPGTQGHQGHPTPELPSPLHLTAELAPA